MRALVTGGRGFIGSHLRTALERRGHDAQSYDLVDGFDMLDPDTLAACVSESQMVFDCAGILGTSETFAHIEKTVACNILGTLNALRACEKSGVPMVYLSLKTDWHSPYLITKRAASEFCLAWHEAYGARVAVVRGLNVYGTGQHWGRVHKAVPTFIARALQGQTLRINGDGNQITDQIHVSDLCEVMIRAWEYGAWGEVIDAGTGVPTTVNALAQMIVKLVGSTSLLEHVPMRAGEPERGGVQLADPSRMVQLLDFYPRVSLAEGMAATVAWYRDHYREVQES